MMRLTLREIRDAVGAVGDLQAWGAGDNRIDEAETPALIPTGVQTDSRMVRPGDLFVCIPGERFDGHQFACEAVRKGAVAVLGSQPPGMGCPGGEEMGAPYLMAVDTTVALGKLARRHREDAAAKVVAITGTAGKTTCKEMLSQVLGRVGVTCKNHLNLNNRLGLPRSILEADLDAAFWVMEAGINMRGEMDELARAVAPDLAIVLNVGAGHLEGLGDVRGVAYEKTRLLTHLHEGGRALVNLDYPELVEEAFATGAPVVGFSAKPSGDGGAAAPDNARGMARYHGSFLGADGQGLSRFRLRLDKDIIETSLPLPGELLVENITAVAGAAHLLGLPVPVIEAGLAGLDLPEQRFNSKRLGGWLVVDDSYNANPLSMARSLAGARQSAGQGALVLALGEMRELGAAAETFHQELGRAVAEAAPTAVFWKGGFAEAVAAGLEEGGYEGPFERVENAETFIRAVHRLELLTQGQGVGGGSDGGGDGQPAVILFKGSRSLRMDELAQAFQRELAK